MFIVPYNPTLVEHKNSIKATIYSVLLLTFISNSVSLKHGFGKEIGGDILSELYADTFSDVSHDQMLPQLVE